MREITYSQGVIVEDPALLATLATFCNKIWLPDTTVADHVQSALADAQDPSGDRSVWEPRRAAVQQWESAYQELFKEGVMARLPGNSPLDHVQHRESDKPLEGPVYDRVILKFHLIRGTIPPGIEFFDDGEAKARVDLAKSIFYIDLPKLTVASPQQILSFRHEAHRAGIADFWREIEEQSKWATGAGQSPVARGEKIRQDWEKWNRDRAWSRGAGVAAGALTTFVVWAWGPHGLESAAEALAAGAALGFIPPWFTEWHARWIEYNSHRREAFKCISRVDKAIRKVK